MIPLKLLLQNIFLRHSNTHSYFLQLRHSSTKNWYQQSFKPDQTPQSYCNLMYFLSLHHSLVTQNGKSFPNHIKFSQLYYPNPEKIVDMHLLQQSQFSNYTAGNAANLLDQRHSDVKWPKLILLSNSTNESVTRIKSWISNQKTSAMLI